MLDAAVIHLAKYHSCARIRRVSRDHAGQPVIRGEAVILGDGNDVGLGTPVSRLAQDVRSGARHAQPENIRALHLERIREAAPVGDDDLAADLPGLAGNLG